MMLTIIYYDKNGEEIQREQTHDDWTQAFRRQWNAWLNDSALEQTCQFDTYELVNE